MALRDILPISFWHYFIPIFTEHLFYLLHTVPYCTLAGMLPKVHTAEVRERPRPTTAHYHYANFLHI